ncbi:hypothetical protein D3C80_1794930 [compost metagenome]
MDTATDGISLREAGIVEHDHQDVRRIGWQVRLLLALLVPGVLQRRLGVAGRGRGWEWQYVLGASDGADGAGEQQAQLQAEVPGQWQLLGHGRVRSCCVGTGEWGLRTGRRPTPIRSRNW